MADRARSGKAGISRVSLILNELNPIRAGLVSHPGEYRWSSYRANALGHDDKLIQLHPIYKGLAEQCSGRQQAYRGLFEHLLDTITVRKIRTALNRELVLGRSSFKDEIERRSNRQARLGKPGRPRVEPKNKA